MTNDSAEALTSPLPALWTDLSGDGGQRRELVRQHFADHIYGRTPAGGRLADADRLLEHVDATSGVRTEEYRLRVLGPTGEVAFNAALFTPVARAGQLPVFIALNFKGNHSLTSHPQLARSARHSTADAPAGRGSDQQSWPVAQICAAGYAVLSAHYDEIEPDTPASSGGVRQIFPTGGPHPWGAIGAWAWGLSRLADLADSLGQLGPIIGMGHSRLGKAALWAAAQDDRFRAVISHQSGLFGASLIRHSGGEDLAAMRSAFPHWLTPGVSAFVDRADQLPVDQHQLLALVAPRGVLVTSGADDHWCDPSGEYLGVQGAAPAFYDREQHHRPQFPPTPDLNRIYGRTLAYYVRPGGHGVTSADWQTFCRYAETLLGTEIHAAHDNDG